MDGRALLAYGYCIVPGEASCMVLPLVGAAIRTGGPSKGTHSLYLYYLGFICDEGEPFGPLIVCVCILNVLLLFMLMMMLGDIRFCCLIVRS